MDVATISILDQPTIGPDNLRSFIGVLDDVQDAVCDPQAAEIAHIATDLRVALGKWHQYITRITGHESIDRLRPRDDRATEFKINIEALRKIELHLSRLILRHSNFGFGALNVPNELDHFFPLDALDDIRTAHVRLLSALRDLPSAQRNRTFSSVTVTEPSMALVCW